MEPSTSLQEEAENITDSGISFMMSSESPGNLVNSSQFLDESNDEWVDCSDDDDDEDDDDYVPRWDEDDNSDTELTEVLEGQYDFNEESPELQLYHFSNQSHELQCYYKTCAILFFI